MAIEKVELALVFSRILAHGNSKIEIRIKKQGKKGEECITVTSA